MICFLPRFYVYLNMNKLNPNKYINKVYNRLTILEVYTKNGVTFAKCKCICGNEKAISLSNIKNKHTESCGCLHKEISKEVNTRHNLSKHPLYHIYKTMLTRCYNKNYNRYSDWGGKGIIICEEWKNNFMNFYNWCIENNWQQGLEIDRKDNNGNYEPDNCRIVTSSINSRNRSSNRLITINGETKLLIEWCEKYNLKYSTISMRLKSGNYTDEEAIMGKKHEIIKIEIGGNRDL